MRKLQAENIIDIHCHILPELDDGSKSMEQTIHMLEIAVSEGISTMICTPHHHLGRVVARYEDCEKRIDEVRAVIADKSLDIELYLGCEICYYEEAVDDLLDGKLHSMSGSRYVLVEFDPSVEYSRIQMAVNEFTMAGYKVIVAHIERYDCMVMEVERCEELVKMGAMLQVNSASVLGDYGGSIKRFIKKLMKQRLVSFVASDAHSDRSRAPRLRESYNYVAKKFGEEYANEIFKNNANKVLLHSE